MTNRRQPHNSHDPQRLRFNLSAEERAAFKDKLVAMLEGGGADVIDAATDTIIAEIERQGTKAHERGYRAGISRFCGSVEDRGERVALGKIDITAIAAEILELADIDVSPRQARRVAQGIYAMMGVRRDVLCTALSDEIDRLSRVAQNIPYLAADAQRAAETFQAAIIIAQNAVPSELVPMPDDAEPGQS